MVEPANQAIGGDGGRSPTVEEGKWCVNAANKAKQAKQAKPAKRLNQGNRLNGGRGITAIPNMISLVDILWAKETPSKVMTSTR